MASRPAPDPDPRRRLVLPDELSGDVVPVARELLGCLLVRSHPDGSVQCGRIVEVEAYCGPEDQASHARRGPESRARVMFGPPGHIYVYLIYGMHHCMNVVTGPPGTAMAVLVRALEPVEGVDLATNGPGRLCKALGIDRTLNSLPLAPASGLWLERDGNHDRPVASSPRIGIDYAPEPWKSEHLRFYLADSKHVSRR